MAVIEASADNIGTLIWNVDSRRGIIIDSMPQHVREAVMRIIARRFVTLCDISLLALEHPSPREANLILDTFFNEVKDEIVKLRMTGKSKKLPN